jgi:hypothetical protein
VWVETVRADKRQVWQRDVNNKGRSSGKVQVGSNFDAHATPKLPKSRSAPVLEAKQATFPVRKETSDADQAHEEAAEH